MGKIIEAGHLAITPTIKNVSLFQGKVQNIFSYLFKIKLRKYFGCALEMYLQCLL